MAQANCQPLPEAIAPAKRVKPEPQDEFSPSGPHLPTPLSTIDCLGEASNGTYSQWTSDLAAFLPLAIVSGKGGQKGSDAVQPS